MSEKCKVAIIGASGYSGEELIRLLLRHEFCELAAVTSRQYAGQALSTVFPRFAETELLFCQPEVDQIAEKADIAFLALPHGLAAEFAKPLLNAGLTVIDISADFRLRDLDEYKTYYGVDHPAPELLKQAVYALPERYRGKIREASLLACPGCYPTSVILPVAALLEAGVVSTEGIIVTSMSGVTGAGRKVDLPYIFPECNESVRAYKVSGHRHLPEIEQELANAAGIASLKINFVPHLVPVNRGINSTIFLNPQTDGNDAHSALMEAYRNEPFVRVLPSKNCADTKHVTLTNYCEIGVTNDPHSGRIIVTSAIDNLTKGASGQAIQCLNINRGFPETTGLL